MIKFVFSKQIRITLKFKTEETFYMNRNYWVKWLLKIESLYINDGHDTNDVYFFDYVTVMIILQSCLVLTSNKFSATIV